MKSETTLAIHWPRFGPYHHARFKRCQDLFGENNIRVVGLQISSIDTIYAWKNPDAAGKNDLFTLVHDRTMGGISIVELAGIINQGLREIDPTVIAICGYSTLDALLLLAWCRRHGRRAIIMSESKFDDANRNTIIEIIKRLIVSQFHSALCGGTPHKNYLTSLGMRPERIFLGYDAVDNDYFYNEAQRVRREPDTARELPGLRSDVPYFLASARFIPRKNLQGLVRAYAGYVQVCRQNSPNHPPWRLVILGDGEERLALEVLIDALGLDHVTLPGFRQIEELPAYYGLASAFIHPPLQEQWGLVVNEAMASGLPVLVSKKCGCVYDLVTDGENGFTFDPEDLSGLGHLMYRVSHQTTHLGAMGSASLARIQDWGLDRFAQGMGQAFAAALG